MNDATTGKTSAFERQAENRTNWERLRTISAEDIRASIEDDPDIHPTDAAFWEGAKVVRPKSKTKVSIQLDTDLLAWFQQDSSYQTRINEILRSYYEAHRSTR
jgi:uncharacterized protein (DUF4415 family)